MKTYKGSDGLTDESITELLNECFRYLQTIEQFNFEKFAKNITKVLVRSTHDPSLHRILEEKINALNPDKKILIHLISNDFLLFYP